MSDKGDKYYGSFEYGKGMVPKTKMVYPESVHKMCEVCDTLTEYEFVGMQDKGITNGQLGGEGPIYNCTVCGDPHTPKGLQKVLEADENGR